ncbi:MAG: aminotransferase class V-fold PLP-dependent enzyme, partial [Bacteroidetes bacterium]|nr:aminotransferase class V-fold PLP-dependent enzyme [Bacteroidota bacterium]
MSRVISFYPGPSRVESKVPDYMIDAYKTGILSINHRSQAFMNLLEDTCEILKKKLNIPESYEIYYTSSATECWEIIAQSAIGTSGSYHVYNGAFGEKWLHYTRALTSNCLQHPFDINEKLNVKNLKPGDKLICLTQNETSNGTQISEKLLRKIRKIFPDNLIAIDASSSMAGVHLDFNQADIWFASVQKCFGLPSGLALIICSPRAVEHAKSIAENRHYNSLKRIKVNMDNWQTTNTPNILGIYLLNRVVNNRKTIKKVHGELLSRKKSWTTFFNKFDDIDFLVDNKSVRSDTVFALKSESKLIEMLKIKALEKDIVLGNGYGRLTENTFRIANFPAIKKKEIKILKTFLRTRK